MDGWVSGWMGGWLTECDNEKWKRMQRYAKGPETIICLHGKQLKNEDRDTGSVKFITRSDCT
jgi:hypothetical protein